MRETNQELVLRLTNAIHEIRKLIPDVDSRLIDNNTGRELRNWLDKDMQPLPWELDYPGVTADEWFFVTTLYGEMNLAGQRTHIRKYFPSLFVNEAKRNIRNFNPDMGGYVGLRSSWMKRRLCRMAEILRERDLTMTSYVELLRALSSGASPSNPTPELDTIVRDHGASGWKTLSVFIRDYVGGNCFPIDSRVEKELKLRGLPVNERLLASLTLAIGGNPRQIARMFYEAGGESGGPIVVAPTQELNYGRNLKAMEGLKVKHYVDSEDEYLNWIKSTPGGFVVNCERNPSSKYVVLHKATCGSINSGKRTNYTTGSYSKMYSDNQEDLRKWVERHGGSLQPCGMCKP
jgi:hypothetical protein